MNKKNFFIVTGICLLSFFLLFLIFYINSNLILYEEKISMTLVVGEEMGFSLDSEGLNFGEILENSFVERDLLIENSYSFPVSVELNSEGDISDFLYYDKFIYLEQNESKQIAIIANSGNNSKGEYSGELFLRFRRMK